MTKSRLTNAGKEDGEAFFAANGHAGMIKKGYTDTNFPYKPTGRIWRIK